MFNSSHIKESRVIYYHYCMKISQIKIMTEANKCNDGGGGNRQLTLLWLDDGCHTHLPFKVRLFVCVVINVVCV